MGFAVDWTISIGNMITFAGMLIAGMAAIFSLRGDVKILAQGLKDVRDDLGKVEKDLDKIATVLVEIGRQEERISSIDRRQNDFNNRLLRIEYPGLNTTG